LAPLQLDGIFYSMIDLHDIPVAFCEVDVKLDDNGHEFECMMVSGHVGSSVEGERKDTVRPLPAWFMFIKEEREDPDVVALREFRKTTISRDVDSKMVSLLFQRRPPLAD
jgi:hypothetical protein